ncbi:hypothetical protein EPN29_03650 [bacterium]|nr:MAG: hypothetical protein EPN29_03650 [bacterium]
MRARALLAGATLLTLSCGQVAISTVHSPYPSASSSRVAGASPGAGPSPQAPHYGLLLSAGTLEVIRPDGGVAASATVAAPSFQSCGQGVGAVLQPPVSATSDEVFFRDGDTHIRYLSPDGRTGDATTVPGGATTISFFSVSPDDQRIAVVVEDMSAASAIGLRLYVEDLHGRGHHVDIYRASVPEGKGATTLWPMGWRQGRLVMAVWAACTFEQVPYPQEWHVVDAATGARQATIGNVGCVPSIWPSAAGVACVDSTQARIYDWTGKLKAMVATQVGQAELSPSGQRLAAAGSGGMGDPSPATTAFSVDGSSSVTTPGHMACLWIDEDHLLAPDAVITLPSGAATPLDASGVCAGRFPGGL